MLNAFATGISYAAHIWPIWRALEPEERGRFYASNQVGKWLAARGAESVSAGRPPDPRRTGPRPVLVASWQDERACDGHPVAYLEHGAGQTYCLAGAGHQSYSGGRGHAASLYLCPNEEVAARWRSAYPETPTAIIGCPSLDWVLRERPVPGESVAISFHADIPLVPETRSAFPFWQRHLADLAAAFPLLGHGHPRIYARLEGTYRRLGIESTPDFEDVLCTSAVYLVDNSSTAFEFAATGRPVIFLNSPRYRREVHHGLRFWEATEVIPAVDEPDALRGQLKVALERPEQGREARLGLAEGIYTKLDGKATERALRALRRFVREVSV